MKFGLILATKFDCSYDYNSLVPLGLGYIAASIQQTLPEVEVVLREKMEEIIPEEPDIVGISAATENYHVAIDWAEEIKRTLGIPVIIGGVHISLLPQSMKRCFDIGVIGEGEITIVELLQSIIKNHGINYQDLFGIRGLCFYNDTHKLVLTPPREPIVNLDDLPRVDRRMLPFHQKGRNQHIFSARGCPYNCSFCASAKFFCGYRAYSVDYIVREIEDLVSEGATQIVFYDDLLIAEKKRMVELTQKIVEKKLNRVCTFSCQVRANLVNDEICSLLKKLNFTRVGVGIESFSDKILKYYNKSGVTAKINQRAIDLLAKHGLEVSPSIIFGAPIETREDMLVTLRALYHNISLNKVSDVGWGTLRPYPGTRIWDWAEQEGIVHCNMDWEDFSDWSNFSLYLCREVSEDEFTTLIDEWLTKFTLLNRFHNATGNIFIDDTQVLVQNRVKYEKIIRERIDNNESPEPGDELILNLSKLRFVKGIYEEENDAGWFWISKYAVAKTDCEKNERLFFTVIIPDFYENFGMLPLTVTVLANDRLIFQKLISNRGVFHFSTKKLPPGNVILKINTDKSFVPKGVPDLQSNDARELSVMLKDVCVMKIQNEDNRFTPARGYRKTKLLYHRFLKRVNPYG